MKCMNKYMCMFCFLLFCAVFDGGKERMAEIS